MIFGIVYNITAKPIVKMYFKGSPGSASSRIKEAKTKKQLHHEALVRPVLGSKRRKLESNYIINLTRLKFELRKSLLRFMRRFPMLSRSRVVLTLRKCLVIVQKCCIGFNRNGERPLSIWRRKLWNLGCWRYLRQ
ncbi:uncharacterized protein LOC114529303 [Dendronephthya gigantea]|uniref:uncharacterized protein LOC114529303 n=1 Tax=Dendronephthya gigantea TaxID=151771 RepID=UPI001069527B|nr:uncharacterized protein LOC114529303 [Dendronephthya gigantea]